MVDCSVRLGGASSSDSSESVAKPSMLLAADRIGGGAGLDADAGADADADADAAAVFDRDVSITERSCCCCGGADADADADAVDGDVSGVEPSCCCGAVYAVAAVDAVMRSMRWPSPALSSLRCCQRVYLSRRSSHLPLFF